MKYTRENIKEGIYNKLDEMYGNDIMMQSLNTLYKQELPEYPIEVEQNVLEWINNLPITEVDCYGESIKRVMDDLNLSYDYFPVVLRNFILFKNGGFRNKLTVFFGLR